MKILLFVLMSLNLFACGTNKKSNDDWDSGGRKAAAYNEEKILEQESIERNQNPPTR